MVMKQNAMRKNLRQSIFRSFGRYLAITAIIMLGAGLFLGLVMTKTDMVATGQSFTEGQNMFDLRMISNYGWTEDYVERFAALPGVEEAEGLRYLDLIAQLDEQGEEAYRFYALPEKINLPALEGGRMPQSPGECLADGYYYDDTILGKTITISPENEDDSLDSLTRKTFTVVGYVSTPLYMDMNRGTTSVGSGSLSNYFYIPAEALDMDYYTEISLTLEGNYAIYSQEYSDALDQAVDKLEPEAEKLSQQRFQELKDEIEEEYNEGYQEYLDGLKEYEDGKAEAEQELADALKELEDGEKELEDSRKQLIDGGKEIEEGYKAIEEGWAKLEQAKAEFATKKAAAQSQLAEKKALLDANADAVNAAYAQATAAISQLNAQIGAIEDSDEIPEEEKQTFIADIQSKIDACQDAITAKTELDAGYAAIAAAEAQLTAAENQLAAQDDQLNESKRQLDWADEVLMINWGKWGQARDELAEGREDYEKAKQELEEELADAEAELKEAEEDLREAREDIDAMEQPDLIILDRESNIGYIDLDSSSDIVAGVSRVFPVFFLLIASLVCITTMTRMIDEERTQIGTLKALGYTSGEIVSKYLIYSGSGAVIGCILGTMLGCTIFPQIIWEAYKIMLHIQPRVVLTVDWPLAIAVSASYLAVMLLVTWYCCYKTLQEEPAQLIRPKAPEVGKKIFLEKTKIWQKLSFLNKVAIRNIFRYRQRLAMMLIGIGGCTALLIAGFGLRDSIVDIVDRQFQNVTYYDMTVYFRREPTEKERETFEKTIASQVESYLYFHQSSVELETGKGVKEIYMIAGDDGLNTFMDLHDSHTNTLTLPGKDEILLSIGVAEALNIKTGDKVTVRSADMEEMELRVSGIYENYVYNYCLVTPETVESHWSKPEQQMAYIAVKDGEDIHAVSAAVTELDSVLNVSVSQDVADMVGGMMEALDLVVMVVVLCAALLAIIVLYNLTNININERIREIATIKVLGFNAGETASYVFKENMVLTVAGSLFGLVLGRFLLEFIMAQIKIDMVWFRAVFTFRSCALAVVLTLLAVVAVEGIFYFKLEKINMAEALKSVE